MSTMTATQAATPNTTRGALDGLKVVDLSRVLGGPYCTQALADHGATVIKIEPPDGDETRGWGPPFLGDTAWYFMGVNRNKEGLALDLSHDEGRAILWRLLEDADVLVENFKPGTLARWGMDYARDLQPRFPRLIHCAVTGFGDDGPLGGLPGYDAVIQAMAGLMSVNGERDGAATRIGLPIVDMVTGLNALAGILLALAERERAGAASRSTWRCTTAACRCCIRTCRISSGRAACRNAAATRIRTSHRTTATARRPCRFSSRWATTGSSRGSSRISGRRRSPATRASSITAAAARTGRS